MSSALSKIYDDHRMYLELCKKFKVVALCARDDFYTHQRQIMEHNKVVRTYYGYEESKSLQRTTAVMRFRLRFTKIK